MDKLNEYKTEKLKVPQYTFNWQFSKIQNGYRQWPCRLEQLTLTARAEGDTWWTPRGMMLDT
jgi:hypothetical protein